MSHASKYVVLVDDDDGIRQATERLLHAAGYSVISFRSAEAMLQAHPIPGASCFLFDVQLPGISGMELFDRLQSGGSSVPVIFITAYDSSAVRKKLKQPGVLTYLTKPFTAQSLISALRQAIPEL